MIWLLVDSSTVGGIERHVATLAQAFAGRGERTEVVLLAPHANNPWLRQLDAAAIPFTILDGTFGGLLRAIEKSAPDIIHTHGYKANILGRFAALWTRTPVVATFHAGERAPFPVSLYQTADEWTSFLGGRIAVSQAIQQAIPFKTRFIENFLLLPPPPVAQNLPRKVGFVGRLSHEKAPDRFCEIAVRCKGIAEFHVWGDGPMRAELEQAYATNVTFHGLVTDLTPVWSSLGLLLMPSRAEGLPMAALEALSSGVPIAAAPIGGLPALVEPGETGWLFDGADLSAAEEALNAWTGQTPNQQRTMRMACWSLVRDRFSEHQQLPKFLAAYQAAGHRVGATSTTPAAAVP